MKFFSRMSPIAAYRDLRFFLSHRSRHELVFGFLAVSVTWAIIASFVHDSKFETPYKRNIQYFESWPLDRTDVQIRAQQKIDAPKLAKAKADLERRQKARQAEFKRLDDKLEAWGF